VNKGNNSKIHLSTIFLRMKEDKQFVLLSMNFLWEMKIEFI